MDPSLKSTVDQLSTVWCHKQTPCNALYPISLGCETQNQCKMIIKWKSHPQQFSSKPLEFIRMFGSLS